MFLRLETQLILSIVQAVMLKSEPVDDKVGGFFQFCFLGINAVEVENVGSVKCFMKTCSVEAFEDQV